MKRTLISIYLILLYLVSPGQLNSGSVTMPSPNAANLGVYGEVPVSYFTGIPNISIPVYSFEERGLSFPITLDYHASGFRPDVHPSWVGMDWNLNFGGVITRTVNKLPDEWKAEDYQIYGYYYSHNWLNSPVWSSTNNLTSLANVGYQNRVDRQPDEFNFNFLGFSGKFYLDHLGKWRVQGNSNIKVTFEESDMIYPFFHDNIPPRDNLSFQTKTFGKFTLIDDKGIKYTFGTSNGIEYSSSITPYKLDYRNWLVATSWFLVDITMPGNFGGVNLEYERGPFQSNFQYYESKNNFSADLSQCTFAEGAKGISGKIISPIYLKSIVKKSDASRVDFHVSRSNDLTYPTSTYFEVFRDVNRVLPLTVPSDYFAFFLSDSNIPFYVNNNLVGQNGVISNARFIWLKLDSITISAMDYTTSRVLKPFQRIKFSYIENLSSRLRLRSVTKSSHLPLDDKEKEIYLFDYNGGQQPDYLYDLTDHWGFANGRPLSVNPSGGYNWVQGNMMTNRQPWDIYTIAGLLKTIIYPTGGTTSFEYELNDYGKYLNEDQRQYAIQTTSFSNVAGGARIKKIINDDGVGKATSKEYFYVKDYDPTLPLNSLRSSGVLDRLPRYNFSISVNSLNYFKESSSSIIPLSSSSKGAHVGYSEVVEKYSDGSFKVFKYTNHDNGFGDVYPLNTITPTGLDIPYCSREFERGYLLSESTFSSYYKKLDETEYSYSRIGAGEDSNFVRSLLKDFGGYCYYTTALAPIVWISENDITIPNTSVFIDPMTYSPHFTTGTAYGYYVYKFLKSKVSQSRYSSASSSNSFLKTETTYQYDQIGNVIKTIATNSKGETINRNFKYPFQLVGIPVYDAMVSNNMLSLVVESDLYNGSNLVEKETTDFDFISNGGIKPKQIRKKIGNGAEFVYKKFNKYSGGGNLLELEGTDGIKNVFIWSYLDSKPVVKITGADYNTVASLLTSNVIGGPQQGDQQMLSEIDNLRTALPNAFVTTYLYDFRFGIKLERDYNSRQTSYEYDGLGRLKNVRDNEQNIVKRYEYSYAAQNAFTPGALNATLDGFRQIEPGRMNSFFNPSGIPRDQSIKDTRLFFRDGVAKLPEEYRTRPGSFYSSLNLNLADPYVNMPNPPRFCFMQDGYSVEWRVKMPANSYNLDVIVLGINFDFNVQFKIIGSGGSAGTYLYGYHDFDGRSYGFVSGGNDFNYIPVDNKDAFDNFQRIKLQVTPTHYRVYYNDVVIREYARNNTPIDTYFYADAGFLGNDVAVDYVKVYNNQGVVQYQEDFNDPARPSKPNPSLICPAPASCQTAFTNYFNQTMGTTYTYSQIAALYLERIGQVLNVCN